MLRVFSCSGLIWVMALPLISPTGVEGQTGGGLVQEESWATLERFDASVERGSFEAILLNRYLSPASRMEDIRADWSDTRLNLRRNGRSPIAGQPAASLRFARPGEAGAYPAPHARYWRFPAELPPEDSSRHPLQGLRIALDPGHVGGAFAQMEGRSWSVGGFEAVREGDLTLQVARLLRQRLERLGAEVFLVREGPEPVTELRPEDLREEAARRLALSGEDGSGVPYAERLDDLAKRLFLVEAEIGARARKINETIRPDLVLALHFNAAPWPQEEDPAPEGGGAAVDAADSRAAQAGANDQTGALRRLVDENHLHILVNGAYLPGELASESVRKAMFERVFSQTHRVEASLAAAIASVFAGRSGLPPFRYSGDYAVPVDQEGYVWARNLLANRVYRCPVIYLEPYVANSRAAFRRLALGDYPGVRWFGGAPRQSIFREYADSVVDGLLAYYETQRERLPPGR